MKTILNGRFYDTESATLIGRCITVRPCDLDSSWEELYRKKNGEFFLIGEGGPHSKYGAFIDKKWLAGGALEVLSEDEARKWAEYNLEADEYMAVFGKVDE